MKKMTIENYNIITYTNKHNNTTIDKVLEYTRTVYNVEMNEDYQPVIQNFVSETKYTIRYRDMLDNDELADKWWFYRWDKDYMKQVVNYYLDNME